MYDCLLDYHKKYYIEKLKDKAEIDGRSEDFGNVEYKDGQWILTLKLKQDILLNNIYGVDIDQQAVEVSQLSLFLKMLEEETTSSTQVKQGAFFSKVLPDLSKNIVCGNSLIGFDIMNGQTSLSFGEGLEGEVLKKLNPMDYETAFPTIMRNGGFDTVVGNPPYIQSRDKQLETEAKKYYYQNYKTTEYQINTFGLFIEKAITILKEKGTLGYIIPNYWLSTKFDKKLREFIFKENETSELLNVYKVFSTAIVDTLILLVKKKQNKSSRLTLVKSIDRNLSSINDRLNAIHDQKWTYSKKIQIEQNQNEIEISFANSFNLKGNKTIGDYLFLKFGVKLYQVGKGKPFQKKEHSTNKVFESVTKIENNYYPLLRARNIQRYFLRQEEYYVKYGQHLAEPRSLDLFEGKRILIQRIVSKKCLDALLLDETMICNTDIITLKTKENYELEFFLGIINSAVCSQYIRAKNINLDRDAYPKINTKTLEEFPIIQLEKIDKFLYNKIIDLVSQMLETKKQLPLAQTEKDKNFLENKCASIDRQIDKLVYELYGLTEEEIRIVEEG